MPKTTWLDQVRDAIWLQHMNIRIEESYISWIRRFIIFHHRRHPKDMGAEKIRGFLSHLAVDRQVRLPHRMLPCMRCFFCTVMCCDTTSRRLAISNVQGTPAVSQPSLRRRKFQPC